MILKTTEEHAKRVHQLVRKQCANCVDGNCLLLYEEKAFNVYSSSASMVSTVNILKMHCCRLTKNCTKKSQTKKI